MHRDLAAIAFFTVISAVLLLVRAGLRLVGGVGWPFLVVVVLLVLGLLRCVDEARGGEVEVFGPLRFRR